jgi:Domain of unknown function (DUF222)/HNH endonuclease
MEGLSRSQTPTAAAALSPASGIAEVALDPTGRAALEEELMTLWGHINAATCRFLELVAEFDRHEGWNGSGIRSCAHWLNVFCGIGTVAAREKVRVARALESLPQISEAFRRGEISYSKVRAMTRIATPAIEEDLLNVARHGTASHIARLVRHFRVVERQAEGEQAEAIQRERYLRTYHEDDGTLVLQARLPAEVGAVVVRAIEAAMALEDRARRDGSAPERDASAEARDVHSPAGTDAHAAVHPESARRDTAEAPHEASEHADDPIGAQRADALAVLAEHFLADQARRCPSSAERYQIVVHIDQALLAGTHDPSDPLQICELEDGPRLALETARRLACDASLVGIVESADGDPLDIGRKTRALSPALRRALNARDRGCRFPGCERHRHTQAHHIEHWIDGGKTKLDNLVTLCLYHHRLLHEGGFGVRIETHGTHDRHGKPVFTRPDGTPVLDRFAARRSRFRGSAGTTALTEFDREIADLVTLNASLGLDIDAATARTRWAGERMDYSQAIAGMYFAKHGRI